MKEYDSVKRLVKDDFDSSDVPASLEPQNIDFSLPKRKRVSAKTLVFRIAAAAAAVAIVICGTVALLPNGREPEIGFASASAADYGEIYDKLRENGGGWGRIWAYGGFSFYAKSDAASDHVPEASSPDSSSSGEADFSGTNIQVEGVDEADIIKTDGKYIYILTQDALKIYSPTEQRIVGLYSLSDYSVNDMYVYDGRVSVIFNRTAEPTEKRAYACETGLLVLDASTPGRITKSSESAQSGWYLSSRMIGGVVYLISEHRSYYLPVDRSDVSSYIPYINDGEALCLAAEDIFISDNSDGDAFVVAAGYDIKTGKSLGSKSLLGSGFDIYCAADRLFVYNSYYVTGETFAAPYTAITAFSLSDGAIEKVAEESIIGTVDDQFSLHWQGSHLFVCTTYDKLVSTLPDDRQKEFENRTWVDANGLFALDENLKLVGSVKDLGLNETIRSARYVNGVCYFVTFEQTDPLFAVDISNPEKLRVISELKIPGYSAYLHPFADNLLLGFGYSGDEDGTLTGYKLSMFDVADPSDVSELFITQVADAKADSEAIYNHKAIYVNESRGLVGIPMTVYGDQGAELIYKLYSYADGGFELKAGITMDYEPVRDGYHYSYFSPCAMRGLHINGVFYAVSPSEVVALSLDSFAEIYRASF